MHELSVDERGDWARALQLARQGYSPEEVADILMPQIIARKTAAVERQRAILDDILDERFELPGPSAIPPVGRRHNQGHAGDERCVGLADR